MLPRLTPRLRDAYLERIAADVGPVDHETLTALQRAHLHAIPFHNLGVLANASAPYAVPSLLQIVRANARGLGGTCHLTTPAFAVLLSALGFEVHLVAGHIRQPDDHLLAMVHLAEGSFVVDVGNGHPYLHPMRWGTPAAWECHGWRFRWDGSRLLRQLDAGREQLVYTVDPAPRTWESFHPAIRDHHEVDGFGPFLASLRAVRVHPERIVVVKDATLTRYDGARRWDRPLTSFEAARRVLVETLELDEEIVDSGLAALAERRPRLFEVEPAVPGIFVAIQTVGRPRQLTALLDSIDSDMQASEIDPRQVRVLIVNNAPPETRPTLRAAVEGYAFATELVDVGEIDLELERSLGLVHGREVPLGIGACRHALVRATQSRLDRLEGPWVVWVLDDDLRLLQRTLDEGGIRDRRVVASLREVVRLWQEHPEISVGLGTFCGDPPIPGFATWWSQVRDLTATLHALKGLGPDDPWPSPRNDRTRADYYYDHSGDALASEDQPPFLYERSIGEPAREVMAQLADRVRFIAAGRQVFRPLVTMPPRAPRRSVARGGHVLFLDPEALLCAPFPSAEGPDGVITRRADSMAALLLAEQQSFGCFEVDLPLLHCRMLDDGSSPMASVRPSRARGAAFIDAQARGIASSRALAERQPHRVAMHLEARRQLHRRGLQRVREALGRARDVLHDPEAWWSKTPALVELVARLEAGLQVLEVRIPDDEVMASVEADVSRQLEAMLEALSRNAETWRSSWR